MTVVGDRLGEVLEAAADAAVIAVSDHGMQPIDGVLCLN
jgi:hypothetical protein